MTMALVIDSSSRTNGSITRMMTQQYVAEFKRLNTDHEVCYRDLMKSLVPHLSAEMIEGFFSPEPSVRAKRATRLSDQLVDEFLAADLLCFAVPVYNFNVPSSLKAYIDQIIRVGRTFTKQADGQLQGLCQGKRAVVLYAMGGMYKGTEMDLLRPYFNTLAQFLALDDIQFINIQGSSRSGFNRDQQLQVSAEQIRLYLQQECLLRDVPQQEKKDGELTKNPVAL